MSPLSEAEIYLLRHLLEVGNIPGNYPDHGWPRVTGERLVSLEAKGLTQYVDCRDGDKVNAWKLTPAGETCAELAGRLKHVENELHTTRKSLRFRRKPHETVWLRSMGKSFEIEAIYASDEAANEHMREHTEHAVIATFGNLVFLAHRYHSVPDGQPLTPRKRGPT